ncbi:regulator of G-protein signaling 16 isoform X2 [Betta splendens]|uniref:Regulator of G-protein signaling 16 isoform X2 n=1 Tax=Betta splendens TaxID=158456 RepID=A0A6P7MDU9_BETSP|nr:regulator of G-protein signaling 16 isoform X2 [Betta splendens]
MRMTTFQDLETQKSLECPQRHRRFIFPALEQRQRYRFQTPAQSSAPQDVTRHVKMPKLLLSRIRFYEIRDLVQNVKQPRRTDIVCNSKRRRRDFQELMVQNTDDMTSTKHRFQTNCDLHLNKLLKKKKYLAAFRTFLQSEYSDENLEFWLACEDFKATSSAEKLRCRAEAIYQEFIQPTARREINVDCHIREKIRKSLAKPSRSCFDEAQKHVYLLMESDSCPRFLQSDAYLSLKHKSRTLWYI